MGDPATNAGVAPVDATAGLKVDLGADNDITGTVTANLSATDNAVLDAIEADTTTIAGAVAGTEMQVDVLTMPTTAVTNAGLTALNSAISGTEVQVDVLTMPSVAQATASNLNAQVVGNVASGSADSGNPVKAGGTHNTTMPTFTDGQRGDLQLTTRGSLKTTLFANDSNTTIRVFADNADGVATTGTGNALGVVNRNTVFNGTTWDRMSGDTTGINVKAVVGALPAGTNNIGDVDILSIAAGDNNIGNVDIVTMPGVVGTVADDATTPGNPVMIGGKAVSPDGTTPTAVAENDVAIFRTDLNRRLLINPRSPQWWSYHEDSSSALTDATVQASPGAGFEIVVTEIVFSTGAATACNIFFEEGASKVLGPWYLEAVAGRGLVWRGEKHITASTALTVTTSAAIAHSVDVQGYIQAV